jgi:carbamoyl-phosphate synthase large subunit
VVDYITSNKIDLVINIPKNFQEEELTNDYIIRRKAVDFDVPLFTNLKLAIRFVDSVSRKSVKDLQIKSWKSYKS